MNTHLFQGDFAKSNIDPDVLKEIPDEFRCDSKLRFKLGKTVQTGKADTKKTVTGTNHSFNN